MNIKEGVRFYRDLGQTRIRVNADELDVLKKDNLLSGQPQYTVNGGQVLIGSEKEREVWKEALKPENNPDKNLPGNEGRVW